MRFILAALTALFAAHAVLGSPVKVRSPYAVKERHQVPARWKSIGAPHPQQPVKLQIGLKPGKFDELERHLYEGMYADPALRAGRF